MGHRSRLRGVILSWGSAQRADEDRMNLSSSDAASGERGRRDIGAWSSPSLSMVPEDRSRSGDEHVLDGHVLDPV
jgi:hypothetical protein